MSPLEKYQTVTASIPNTTAGKMFGALCLKTPNGKAACLFKNEVMAFKLDEASAAEALQLKGAQTFEPSPGKKLNGWIQVPFQHANKWEELTNKAVKFVGEL